MKTLLLTRKDVQMAEGTDVQRMIPVVEEVFRTHAYKDLCQPLKPYLRIPQDTKGRRIIAMPAYLGGKFNAWGIKWIASSPTNPFRHNMERASALIILNDLETGFPIAIMEGAAISATRTAAVAGIAAKYLAPKDARVLGLIGAGAIARAVSKGIFAVNEKLEKIKVFDLDKSRSYSLRTGIEKELGIDVSVMTSAQEAVQEADITIPATTATTAYIEGDWLKQGSLFINISLRDPKFSVVERADKIIVDDWIQANRENTVLHLMYEKGLLKDEDIYAEIGEIVAGYKAGRENKNETIFFNPMGMAVEDLGVAVTVYEEAKKKSLGKYFDFLQA